MLNLLFEKKKVRQLEPTHPEVGREQGLAHHRTTAALGVRLAPVIGVLSAKGGAGATTTAINLAACLAKNHVATTLVDANLQQPDAAALVSGELRFSLLDLIGRAGDLDQQAFEACCIEVGDLGGRLKLLSPPLSGDGGLRSDLTQLSECLEKIRMFSNFWLVDLPNHLDKHLVTFADRCDCILLLFEATITGVAACRRWLTIFKNLGYPDEKVVCVLNRAGSKKSGIEKELTACFADRPIVSIPNAYGAAWDSSTQGQLLVLAKPRHSYTRAMERLAADMVQRLSVSATGNSGMRVK